MATAFGNRAARGARSREGARERRRAAAERDEVAGGRGADAGPQVAGGVAAGGGAQVAGAGLQVAGDRAASAGLQVVGAEPRVAGGVVAGGGAQVVGAWPQVAGGDAAQVAGGAGPQLAGGGAQVAGLGHARAAVGVAAGRDAEPGHPAVGAAHGSGARRGSQPPFLQEALPLGRRTRGRGSTPGDRPAEHASGQAARRGEGRARATASHLRTTEPAPGPVARVRSSLAAVRDRAVATPSATRRRAGVVALAALVAVALIYPPARDWYVATRTSQDLQACYDELTAENDGLERDLDRLQTRDGIEDEAHRRGYVVPGETSVIVENLPDEAEDVAEEAASPAELASAAATRVLDLLFGYAGAR